VNGRRAPLWTFTGLLLLAAVPACGGGARSSAQPAIPVPGTSSAATSSWPSASPVLISINPSDSLIARVVTNSGTATFLGTKDASGDATGITEAIVDVPSGGSVQETDVYLNTSGQPVEALLSNGTGLVFDYSSAPNITIATLEPGGISRFLTYNTTTGQIAPALGSSIAAISRHKSVALHRTTMSSVASGQINVSCQGDPYNPTGLNVDATYAGGLLSGLSYPATLTPGAVGNFTYSVALQTTPPLLATAAQLYNGALSATKGVCNGITGSGLSDQEIDNLTPQFAAGFGGAVAYATSSVGYSIALLRSNPLPVIEGVVASAPAAAGATEIAMAALTAIPIICLGYETLEAAGVNFEEIDPAGSGGTLLVTAIGIPGSTLVTQSSTYAANAGTLPTFNIAIPTGACASPSPTPSTSPSPSANPSASPTASASNSQTPSIVIADSDPDDGLVLETVLPSVDELDIYCLNPVPGQTALLKDLTITFAGAASNLNEGTIDEFTLDPYANVMAFINGAAPYNAGVWYFGQFFAGHGQQYASVSNTYGLNIQNGVVDPLFDVARITGSQQWDATIVMADPTCAAAALDRARRASIR
jgi:hypothetical protein